MKREDVFLISKVTSGAQREGRIKEELEISLRNLKTDYLDLYLLHWPLTEYIDQSWETLEKIYNDGRVRAIGICNASVRHLKILENGAHIKPMVNEVECHPLLQQWEVRTYCKEQGIQMIAHTPTGKMREEVRNSPILQRIAQKHSTHIAQVILRWHYQLGDISIPNTTSIEHVRENLSIWDFELSEEEMEQIHTIDANIRIWPNSEVDDLSKW